ncbi:hypothetical protein ABZV77_23975 [Streptomyces sp. NPDC004732]|uniref:hypothetical protein n=1 Tax=Streptomyces sp. NPDC004732 TaxID=3154290 RepID=UPI0033B4F255
MRALPVRRLATTTLCATLLLGTAGPALASDGDASREATRTAPRAPAPDASALLGQAQQLGGLGGVLTPVTDLLTAVLKAPDSKLSPEDAKKHVDAVKAAIDAAAKAAPAAPGTGLPSVPEAPKLPTGGAQSAAKAPMDAKADALAALQKAVDELVKAATAGDPKAVLAAAPGVLLGLVNAVVATVLGGGLPAPNLPGLPSLPKLPTGGLPQTPALPQAPAL